MESCLIPPVSQEFKRRSTLEVEVVLIPKCSLVFVLGDVGNLQPPQAVHADAQVRHLMTQLDSYFSGEPIKPYIFDSDKVLLALSLGRDRGTAQAGSLRLPSILVWWVKSRYLGTNYFEAYAKGNVGGAGKAWPK